MQSKLRRQGVTCNGVHTSTDLCPALLRSPPSVRNSIGLTLFRVGAAVAHVEPREDPWRNPPGRAARPMVAQELFRDQKLAARLRQGA